MEFNNLNFILIFLPSFLLIYFLVSNNYKNLVILIFSILFYFFGNINHLENFFLLIVLTLINYLLCKMALTTKNKLFVFISIFVNIAILVAFKINIFSKNIPAGLSFYTFHYISVIADIMSAKIEQNNFTFTDYISYILFFPKLLSGPITRYNDFNQNEKNISMDNFITGLSIFAIGLGYKCILSDNISYIINQINTYGIDSVSIITAWIGMFSYSAKLYFDFAGYSLISIGIALMIGINLPQNFNLPFSSKSISEFWRRWHITLGQFFRDYVYIPLGGNCQNKNLARQIFNIFVVWVLTGLWHGFKLNYIFWAMSIFILIALEKIFLNKVYNKFKVLGNIIVLLFIPLSFLMFSIEDLTILKSYISKLFDISSLQNLRELKIIMNLYWKIIVLGLIFMTNYPHKIYNKIKKYKVLMFIISLILIIISCYMINIGQNDTFKYFTF